MFRSLTIALAVIFLSATIISAQLVQRLPSKGASQTVIAKPGSTTALSGKSVIHGTAVDADSSPLANASVRLRNLLTNKIEKVATANQLGEFTFEVQPNIPYVVELVDRAGRVIAVGNVVTTQAGDVASTIVAAPLRLKTVAGVFGDSVASVISAATGAGLTAVQANDTPPVSPDH